MVGLVHFSPEFHPLAHLQTSYPMPSPGRWTGQTNEEGELCTYSRSTPHGTRAKQPRNQQRKEAPLSTIISPKWALVNREERK